MTICRSLNSNSEIGIAGEGETRRTRFGSLLACGGVVSELDNQIGGR
jgi:hypothetical protein